MKDLQLGILGCPVTHSLSPYLHNYFLKKNGYSGFYRKYEIDSQESISLKRFVTQNKLTGFNVTIPFKEKIIDYLDEIDKTAEKVGAVNTVALKEGRRTGFNTDIGGFLSAIQQNSIELCDETAVVLGAGGAARSVVYGLIQSGIKKIFLANRTPGRGIQLKESIYQARSEAVIFPIEFISTSINEKLKEAGLFINTTPVGMWPDIDRTPFEFLKLHKSTVVVDLIYNPFETLFLKQARNAGAVVLGGLDMFIYQGKLAFEMWTGKRVNVDYIEIRNLLVKKMKTYEPN